MNRFTEYPCKSVRMCLLINNNDVSTSLSSRCSISNEMRNWYLSKIDDDWCCCVVCCWLWLVRLTPDIWQSCCDRIDHLCKLNPHCPYTSPSTQINQQSNYDTNYTLSTLGVYIYNMRQFSNQVCRSSNEECEANVRRNGKCWFLIPWFWFAGAATGSFAFIIHLSFVHYLYVHVHVYSCYNWATWRVCHFMTLHCIELTLIDMWCLNSIWFEWWYVE